jgi:phosphoglycerate kinase
MSLPLITDVKSLAGKTVLVRSDFNVPIKDGKVVDDFKIVKGLKTIRYLIKREARIVIVSHLGRPEGVDPKLTLQPVRNYLERVLEKKIDFFVQNPGAVDYWDALKDCVKRKTDGDVILLENIRFFKEEEQCDILFAKRLAGVADYFVLDGFGVSHRSAASVVAVGKYLPHFSGLLLADEIDGLEQVTKSPACPLVVVIGGAKMETKIPILKKIIPLADAVLVGGGIANTYWWAQGRAMGGSLIDADFKQEALLYGGKKKIVLPVDVVVGPKNGRGARVMPVGPDFQIIDPGLGVYDVGPRTVALFATYLKSARTILWNGALGYFEQPPYHFGTHAIARAIAHQSKGKTFGVCGGGETVEILQKLDLLEDIDLVSTGGGAMLEFLSGKKLPGIEALRKK